MKRRWIRITLIALGVFILIVTAAIIVTLNASFQTYLVRTILQKNTQEARLERIHATLSGLKVVDLYLHANNGLKIQLEQATVELSVWKALWKRDIAVSLLHVKGLEIDQSRVVAQGIKKVEKVEEEEEARADEAEMPSPFTTIQTVLDQRPNVWLDGVDVEGLLRLSSERQLQFTVKGGQVAPGQKGHLDFMLEVRDKGAAVKLSELGVKGRLEVEQSPEALGVALNVSEATAAEGSPEIIRFNSSYEKGTVKGSYQLYVDKARLMPFVGEVALPAFTVEGKSDYQVTLPEKRGTISGEIDAKMAQLAVFQPQLKPFDTVGLKAAYAFAFTGKAIEVKKLTVALQDAQDKRFFRLQNLRSVRLPLKTAMDISQISGEVVKLEIEQVPFEWIAAFLPDWELAAEPFSATVSVAVDGNWALIKPVAPFEIKGLSLAQKGGAAWLQAIDIKLQPHVDYDWKEQQLSIHLEELSVASQLRSLISMKMNAEVVLPQQGRRPLSFQGEGIALNIALSELFQQPILVNRFKPLASGAVTVQGDVTWEQAAPKAAVAVSVTELQSTAASDEIATLSINLDVTQAQDAIAVTLPLRLIGPAGVSEAKLTLQYQPTDGEKRIEAAFDGKSLWVADLQVLAQIVTPQKSDEALPPPTTEVAVESEPTAPSEAPFWQGYGGHLKTEIDTVILPGDHQVRDVKIEASMNPDSLAVESLRFDLDPSRFILNGRIVFDQESQTPYGLTAAAVLKDFDVGAYLKQAHPEKEPVVEGLFEVETRLNGKTADLKKLPDTLQGDFVVKSRNGLLKPSWNDEVEELKEKVGGIADIAELVGADVNVFKEVAQIFAYVEMIPFDSLHLKVGRSDDLNIKITDYLIKSQELYITGKGEITYQENVPILEFPLYVEVQVAARDRAAEALEAVLTIDKDSEGFFLGPRWHVRGELGKPDLSTLHSLVLSTIRSTYLKKKGLKLLGEAASEILEEDEEDEEDERDVKEQVKDVLLEGVKEGISIGIGELLGN